MSFYLESCIRPDAILRWIQKRYSIKCCANLGKSALETLVIIIKAFREESMSSQWKSPNSLRLKKARQVKSKVKGMLIIFFDINLSWQATQSIPHTTVTFYGDCMKICEDFAPNFGDKRTGC
jgi:hypothetical protein